MLTHGAGNARGVSKTLDEGSDGSHKKALLGTLFTCFTGTKFQILTLKALLELLSPADVDILWPSRNRPLTVVRKTSSTKSSML